MKINTLIKFSVLLLVLVATKLNGQTVNWNLFIDDQSNTPTYSYLGATSGSFTMGDAVTMGYSTRPDPLHAGWDDTHSGDSPLLDAPGEYFEINVTFDTPVSFSDPAVTMLAFWQGADYTLTLFGGATIDTSGITGLASPFTITGSGTNSIFLDAQVVASGSGLDGDGLGGSGFTGSMGISGTFTGYTMRQEYNADWGSAGFGGGRTGADNAAIFSGTTTAVPEPSSALYFGVIAMLGVLRRKR